MTSEPGADSSPGFTRCGWCGSDSQYVAYHDHEWGVPIRDDRRLFEMLVLEGAQAGLSWLTILRKRDAYRRAFHGFDPERIAGYTDADVERLMADAGIVRNRRKIEAAIRNARGFIGIVDRERSFSTFLWRHVEHVPQQNAWRSQCEIPVSSAASERMSRELKKRGFSFVGPTICYAFMQATGMVNDHVTDCFRHAEVRALAAPAESASGRQDDPVAP